MKTFLTLIIAFFIFSANAQENKDDVKIQQLANGNYKIEATDPLGAQVVVIYNRNKEKIYQERTANDETTFSKFEKGYMIEFGTLYRTQAYNGK